MHDDATYWATAKAMAEGRGYRMPWVAGEPYQILYPPFYALLLSVTWILGGTFSASAKLAVLLNWLMLPLFLFVTNGLAQALGIRAIARGMLAFWLAWNPLVILLSANLMSDLLFTSAFVAAVWGIVKGCAPETRERIAVFAGCAGAFAYLTRTAGIVVLPAGLLCFLVQRQYKRAALFFAAMAPALAGWELWIRVHGSVGYLSYYSGTTWSYRWAVALINLNGGSQRFANLLLSTSGYPRTELVSLIVSGIAILGLLFCAVYIRSTAFAVAAIGLCYAAMVIAYPIPTTSRYLLPVLPITLIVVASRGQDFVPRNALLTSFVTMAAGYYFLVSFATYSGVLPAALMRSERTVREMAPVYDWLRGHSPSDRLFSENAAMVYLRTERITVEPFIQTLDWYKSQEEMNETRAERLLEAVRRDGGLLLVPCGSTGEFDSDPFCPAITDRLVGTPAQLVLETRAGKLYRFGPAR